MILEVRDLYTSCGLSQILFGVSLEVNEGECVALLGRNGDGKTTTLRSIMGLTSPRQGEVFIKAGILRACQPIVWPSWAWGLSRKIGVFSLA